MSIDLSDPKYYENRELSWIKFNRRVLNEAVDKNVPLLEKLKFTAITSSNLDEFFMVRVASLKDMQHAGVKKTDIAGMTPAGQLAAVEAAVREMVDIQYSNFNRSVIPMLKKNNIIIHGGYEELTAEQKEAADAYFDEFVFPVLTPMAVDASRPFPLIRNRTLNIAAMVKKNKQSSFATVQVPSGLPRAVKLISSEGCFEYILLEDLIIHHMDRLFLGHEILTVCPYRIMRDADFELDEEEAADLLQEIEKKLKKRQWGEVIRLEVRDDIDKSLLKYLKKELNITDDEIFRLNGPLDLTFLMKLYSLEGKDDLRYPPHTPAAVPEFKEDETIFDSIKRNDIFVHHPYQSFDPVVRFIRDASADPDVLAIKQTLYRVSGNSPIIAALAHAAESGKQVTVLVELKARFDEENNIV
ncbi:MAG: polyphosphate kinase 1, partial [Lachnospiraceae bacterium]|nr:polyphosphate kinase 1 [Lachnospiraceae bacterium]